MRWLWATVVGLLCIFQAEARSHLPRDMDRYAQYDKVDDSYLDQLRDETYEDTDEYYDDDYSGDYYDEYDDENGFDDDEDRDYREWLSERKAYFQGGYPRQKAQEDPYYRRDRDDYRAPLRTGQGYPQRQLPPKYEVYDKAYIPPRSAVKSEETVGDMQLKLNDMQNEIDDLRGMLSTNQLGYRGYRKNRK